MHIPRFFVFFMNGFSLHKICQGNIRTKKERNLRSAWTEKTVGKPCRPRREANEIGVNEASQHYYVLSREEQSATSAATFFLVPQDTFNVQKVRYTGKLGFKHKHYKESGLDGQRESVPR
jgi:hypothetical protein